MDFAFLSESPADEDGLHVLTQHLIPGPFQRTSSPVHIRRGWPAVRNDLQVALRAIYHQTTAQFLVIVVDADGAPLEERHPQDRLTQLRYIAEHSVKHIRADRPLPKIAIGLAVPSIEAWWLAPHDATITEAAWLARGKPGGATFTKLTLKRRLYGTEDPALAMETATLRNGAQAVAQFSEILAARFPYGFKPMLSQIQSWNSQGGAAT